MERISWVKNGTSYVRMEGDIENIEHIPYGVYEIGISMSGWYLSRTADDFEFNYKIYDIQNNFLDYITKTYQKTNGNLGVLFWGIRGSGKTISAKILAKMLHLPVIIIKSMGDKNDQLLSYLSSFNFDCVLFFDEFEKQFSEDDPFILQLMDGVYNSKYRKVFLLTTNELNINENLLSRPSRIRYVREFGNISKESVIEYFNDNLNDKCCINELLDYIDTLTISTIDIIKSVTEEVNIHGTEDFLAHREFFNVQLAKYNYIVLRQELYKGHGNFTPETVNEKFVKPLTDYKHRFEVRANFDKEYSNAKTDEEKEAISLKIREFERTIDDIDTTTFYSNAHWSKLEVGDKLFDREPIIHIDVDNCLIITRYGNYTYGYMIQNPNEVPSIYKKSSVPSYVY